MKIKSIPSDLLREIYAHAEKEYPEECCGFILGPRTAAGELDRARACRNAQDEYHTREPRNFPRTARTAFFMDPRDLLAVQKEARARDGEIRVIYHSHIDAAAYFSGEDKRMAAPDGSPAWPGVYYLVISVMKGKATESRLFSWDTGQKDFRKEEG